MRSVSDRFLAAVRGSHRAASQALVLPNGQNGVNPLGGTTLGIIEGDVKYDATAQVRSSLALTIEGTGLYPRRASDLLSPLGNEIYARRGLDYGGGQIEYVGLGYFRIDSVEQDEAPDGPIRITASDRMAGIVDARLTAPEQFDSGWTYGEIVEYLVTTANGFAVLFDWDDTALRDTAITRAVVAEEDRYGFLDEMITSLGKIWYWDHRGHVVIKDQPAVDEPVWTCDSGAGGVLIEMSRDLSRTGVYNGVVVTSEAFDSDVPFRALAVDGEPTSPTYWNGDFGKIPRFFSSPFITNLGQAQRAAENLLKQNLGLPYSVDFTNVPNPALEPWDPILIKLKGRKEYHYIETLVIPLSSMQPQTGTTRQQTSVLIGEA